MDLISIRFLLFTALTVAVYYLLPLRLRPYWLLACSVCFYLCADLRYILFLGLSVGSTYLAARALPKSPRRKLVLALTLVLNLGLMTVLKFLPYTLDLGERYLGLNLGSLRLIYPLGISFYTLQAAGYLIDVYRGKYPPEKRFWLFALFMSFFPIIVQGPISRYEQLSPQLAEGHALRYENLAYGAQLALWGYFKKMVVADRAGILVDQVYNNFGQYGGVIVIVAAMLYFMQLYADFSGCVDVCRGVSRMLGIELAENFRRPLLSDSMKEFWRRWHISLCTWLKDYLYIPLGGSRRGKARKYLNTLIIFTVSGLWHGTGLNYMLWGALHGCYLVIDGLAGDVRKRRGAAAGRGAPRWLRQIAIFILLFTTGHIVRAPGVRTGAKMLVSVFRGFYLPALWDGSLLTLGLDGADLIVLAASLLLMLLVALWQEKHPDATVRGRLAALPLPLRWGLWLGGLLTVLILGIYGPGYSSAQFIYMGF